MAAPTEAAAASLTLPVRNDIAALEPARRAVVAALAPLALSARAVYRVELVLEEMLMNRVWHAWPDGGVHETRLTVRTLPDAVQLVFEDDGVAFDPLGRPEAEPAPTLADAPTGGRGLMLTQRAVRSARYERVGGFNRLVLEIARE